MVYSVLAARHFFQFAPQRRAPPFLVRASVAVALKVVQVPNTGFTFFNIFLIIYVQPSKLLFLFCLNSSFLTVFCPHVSFTYLSLFYDCVSTKKTPKERPSPSPPPSLRLALNLLSSKVNSVKL